MRTVAGVPVQIAAVPVSVLCTWLWQLQLHRLKLRVRQTVIGLSPSTTARASVPPRSRLCRFQVEAFSLSTKYLWPVVASASGYPQEFDLPQPWTYRRNPEPGADSAHDK